MARMRIALISPYSCGPVRGNITTVNRISRFLTQAGCATYILAADRLSFADMLNQLNDFNPDLIHGFHAHHSGAITRKLAERQGRPYSITITGSDIHDPLLRDHPETLEAIQAAEAIICFDQCDVSLLTAIVPRLTGKISLVPQGVEPLPIQAGESFGLPNDAFILLLPAALRLVKRIEFPLQALASLTGGMPSLRLVIAGGVIEQNYAATIRGLLCDAPFATWLGEVPHEQMGNLYHRADLVLNCSVSESMPNSLMEAMALGRPLLAADIPGNRSLIRHGETGWLFSSEDEFRERILRLAHDSATMEECGRRAREYVLEHHSPRLEAERLLALYRSLV
jgi:glycosyltransferase involved in cell wall biosynthesis